MAKNKRMIYLWDENLEFYDSLTNKSGLLNLYIEKLRSEETPEVEDKGSEFDEKLKRLDGRIRTND